MQPSSKWGTDYVRFFGANIRSGASDVNDPDFTDYPAFHFNQIDTYPGNSYMHIWWLHFGIFPLNQPIDDWTFAYTGVNSTELSHTNIGIFDSTDFTNPKYKTDNNNIQQIAFLNNLRYTINVTDHGARSHSSGIPQFPVPPYSNNLYVYSPNAAGGTVNPNTFDLSQVNFNGYATTIRSFGLKSWFLEIRVSTVFIGGEYDSPLPNADYSLKDYLAFTQHDRDVNPISRAFARVYIRNSTAGTYDYRASNFWQFYPVLSIPFAGNGINNIYCYFNLVTSMINQTNNLDLPLFGLPNDRKLIGDNKVYITPQSGFLDFFYGWDKISGVKNIDTDSCIFYMLPTAENIEYIRKCCAAYGLFFCDSILTSDGKDLSGGALEANDGRWLHNDMYLGIIEDSGYTEGRYSRGISNGLQSQYNWKDSTESTYNPDVPPVPENHYSSSTTFNSIGNLATLTRRYALSGGAVTNLGKNLWKISDDIAVSDPLDPYAKYDAQILNTFLTSNPIDCIISLRRYPLTLPYGSSTTIKLGKVDTLVSCYEMDEPCHTYEFRGIPIMPNFGNSFLDYAPYTEFELYVPFCGTTKLNPADILGRTLNVKLVVDFDTGTCTGYIMSNNLVIETINGSIAIDIPVTGTDSTTVQAQLSHGIITAESAKTQERMTYGKTLWPTGIVSAALNPFGTANTFAQNEANVNKAQYDVEHTVAPSHVIGSASPVSKWAIDLNCRLIIYYPTGKCIELVNGVPQFESNELNMFGAHVGFATLDEVSHYDTYTGLVVGANPKLGQMQTQNGTRYATADELNMIRQAIEQGIII